MNQEQSTPFDESLASAGPIIDLQNVHKWYGEIHVLKDINMTVKKSEWIVICGPSGSGNSTPNQIRLVIFVPKKDLINY